MSELAQWAMAYAKSLGWYVFPLAPCSKHPMTTNGFKDASNDLEQVRAWWTSEPQANIGVDCGRSNLAVIDLDGVEAIEYWNLVMDSLALPENLRCAVQQTSSGNHLVFAQGAERIRNSQKKLHTHIDTRGDGGYIVLAPSIHPSGAQYQWIEGQEPQYGFEPLPQEIVARLREAPATPQKPPQSAPAPNLSRTLQRAYGRMANATEGTRNGIINKAAWYLFGLVREGKLDEGEVTEIILAGARRCAYPDSETLSVLRSVAAHR